MKQHVILVGLPGSGKTTAGRRAAEMLSSEFTDIDEAVEGATGRSIAAIFAEPGEPEFRKLERQAMDAALARPPHLIAAGAGWIAEGDNLEAARAAGAAVLYLSVSPQVAAARLGNDQSRPLLAGGNSAAKLDWLLQRREDWYQKADNQVDATAPVEEVAAKLVELLTGAAAE